MGPIDADDGSVSDRTILEEQAGGVFLNIPVKAADVCRRSGNAAWAAFRGRVAAGIMVRVPAKGLSA